MNICGGCLANVPLWLFAYVAKSLWSERTPALELEMLSMLIVALGGIIAGYMVVRRVESNHLRIGLKTGVSAFVVNLVFSSIVLEGTSILYGIWILLLFCCTAVAGSYLRKITTG